MEYVVSACLAGCRCRYDGKATPNEAVRKLVAEGRALPLCPEQLGGLPTPRTPFELLDGRAVNKEGEDVTEFMLRGVEEAMQLVKLAGCTKALLKSRSPSCGAGLVYDGTFSSIMVDGDGLFAAACKAAGLDVKSLDEEA